MKTLEIEVTDNKGNNWTIDLFEHSSNDAILEHINSELEAQADQDEEHEEEEGRANPFEEVESFEVIDWGEIPANFQSSKIEEQISSDLEELIEELQKSGYGIEVFEAAKECGVNLSDVDEAYTGEHDSDEDFARQLAEDIGAIDKNANWPNTCIDWEQAAKELMYDYCSDNNHYFRNI